ncbi:Coenzyme F420 hydrogenase/dehydrogenase, beta subunit C-terminal domain [Aliiroseovarius subalbicans]|uniref:Coenzyme F420 hydrogenase/dehydrogenase, beta subunit C-terminal domain n=1 Tax=Aliiroseovarius subalbicans TaxID=2925840 RepID=UPI001F58E095|nr:Coenzyme F420 hydrogenase/dehydrogenase, beta subunit C-terminal domain [Aliiroseovarius subalbicans]MCI2401175.1 Coenzyme F420 hydrogenase/dehydrogenase, beta subunit C-terminal domain [Aliiroseovarius subalbicans]
MTTSEGYLRPLQYKPVSKEQDAVIAQICPGLQVIQEEKGSIADPLWGSFESMYCGHAIDAELRHTASSGGVLSALLVHLIEIGAVDAVLQVAGDPDLAFGNRTVISQTRQDILNCAGSRYAPSSPLAGLNAFLASDRKYAFVGKPCDVAALNALKREDDRVSTTFPFLLSFFCAGVPSLDGAREVLSELNVDEADLAAFRYRGNGWPGHTVASLEGGGHKQMTYAESWGGILSRHVQFRCKICPDGTGGAADVACADAWETDEKGYPVFEERNGISLVVGRTRKGEALIQEATAAGRIALEEFDRKQLIKIQPGQTQKRRYTLSRLLALYLLFRPRPRYRGFHLLWNAKQAGVWANLRNFLGTLRRISRGRY